MEGKLYIGIDVGSKGFISMQKDEKNVKPYFIVFAN